MRKQSARASLLIEHIRAACMRSTRLCNLRLPAAALLSLGSLSPVFAGPSGGVVVAGQGTISTPVAGTTVIEQASPHLQVDWRSFDVAVGERVQFRQPSSAAVALNRILAHNPSQILGSLEANGKVVLVNPNGLVFGPSARINVGSLVASSLEVVGFDATSGRFSFGDVSGRAGAVINQGQIGAAPGGSVTLLGGQVSNTGSIIADFGTVNLAAGRTATIDLAGDGLLRLEVDAELVTNAGGAAAAVDNAGNIQANGGRVLLTAQALDGVFANLVNNDGTVRANRIDHSGGTIRLVGAGGTVRSSGTLDASAGDALSDGGRVEVLGERVGLFGEAVVDVSGARHGGTALIGGDYQGNNPQVPNAARTYVGANARIAADAGAPGDGGR
ncbi:MAG: filamentous hemagglutinin, partial [Proteobacteria bacterium]